MELDWLQELPDGRHVDQPPLGCSNPDFLDLWVYSSSLYSPPRQRIGRFIRLFLVLDGWLYKAFGPLSACWPLGHLTGFVRVMENLESHGILKNCFPGLESHGFFYLVMENISFGHGK